MTEHVQQEKVLDKEVELNLVKFCILKQLKRIQESPADLLREIICNLNKEELDKFIDIVNKFELAYEIYSKKRKELIIYSLNVFKNYIDALSEEDLIALLETLSIEELEVMQRMIDYLKQKNISFRFYFITIEGKVLKIKLYDFKRDNIKLECEELEDLKDEIDFMFNLSLHPEEKFLV